MVPDLIELLREVVNAGASLGFLPPVAYHESRDYWMSISDELWAGSRLLLAAFAGERLVGCGQLALSPWPNSRHRAEIQKLFVAGALRGRGVGRALLDALHEMARARGRFLVHLNTQQGGVGERFYKGLGYTQAGLIPGFTVGPSGDRRSVVTLYRELA
jgi:GNAT superfamily N-acetyltransferase